MTSHFQLPLGHSQRSNFLHNRSVLTIWHPCNTQPRSTKLFYPGLARVPKFLFFFLQYFVPKYLTPFQKVPLSSPPNSLKSPSEAWGNFNAVMFFLQRLKYKFQGVEVLLGADSLAHTNGQGDIGSVYYHTFR